MRAREEYLRFLIGGSERERRERGEEREREREREREGSRKTSLV